jgi:hypothetical protein
MAAGEGQREALRRHDLEGIARAMYLQRDHS